MIKKKCFCFLPALIICLSLLPAQIVQAEEKESQNPTVSQLVEERTLPEKRELILPEKLPETLAAEPVTINTERFPDEAFRSYVKTLSGGEDGQFTPEELAGITEIKCSGRNIQTLQGVELFSALSVLWCSDNQLTSLNVSRNTALTDLDCSNNQLTSLDVSRNTVLADLYCSDNQLTSLDVRANTALADLSCGLNGLTDLDVSRNTALNYLDCSYSQLTSLDVSQNTALADLYCNDNELTSLNVSQNTALADLYCDDNELTSLDVRFNTALEELRCTNNNLTMLDVSKNTALVWLECGCNELTALDVSQNKALTHLDCSSNDRMLPDGAPLAEWMPDFDLNRADKIQGGSFEDGKIHFSADQLTYTYAFGNDSSDTFTLEKQPGNYLYSRDRKILAFSEQPSTLMIASYDENGRLLGCELHEVPANTEGAPFELGKNQKAFLLSKNNTPLCEARGTASIS